MKIVKIFAALVGLTFVFIFCSSNDTKVALNFLEYSTPETYLFLYVLSAFVLGMIAASLTSTLKIMQLKRQINKLQPDGVVAPQKEKKKNKKEKKGEEQPVTQQAADSSNQQSAAVVVPPVVAPSVATVSDLDENVSDAVFEDDSTVVTEEEASPQVIELPHDNLQDISSTDKK